jgi:putative membrane protein
MKTNRKILSILLNANLIIATLGFLSSCNNAKQADADMGANTQTDTTTKGKDAKFLAKVALINMEEIRLGELAQQNSSTKEIKDLGEMMVDDHKKSQDELVQLAAKKSISLPIAMDAAAEADYKKLSGISGTEFDKEYTDMMVNGHKDAITLFDLESNDAQDSDIRHWAGTVLPTLQKHLDHATACQAKLKSM